MNKAFKKKWVKALRSGEYEQTQNRLCDGNGGMCCLGVLCDISRLGEWEEIDCDGPVYKFGKISKEYELSTKMLQKFGLHKRTMAKLIKMNDQDEMSFDEIADYIEEKL